MKKGEIDNSLLPKLMAAGVLNNHLIVVESKLYALVDVCKQILAELKDYNFDEDDIFAVHLALDEAFMNAYKHGNKMDHTKKIQVEYSVDADKIQVSITDEGNGFELDSVADPRFGAGLNETSGRGILLMKSYMDTVKYNGRGNRVYMVRYKEKHTRDGATSTEC